MSRRTTAMALAVAAVLSLTGVLTTSAAAEPAQVSADDVIVPSGDGAGANGGGQQGSGSSRVEREAALARGDREAADLVGYLPSLYQGKWYMPNRENVRRCIMDRESHANYRASSGTYFGAYQMSAALAVGATWMMQDEVRKEMGADGVAIVKALRGMTPNKWNRYWQDRAFWTIWRNGGGASHWGGGASNC